MKKFVAAAGVLVPLSLAVHLSAPESAGSAVLGAGHKVGWDLCTIPKKAADSEIDAPIPRILHQSYKTLDLPPVYRQSHESWLQQTPSWEHHIWTDADNRELIATHYSWFLETYDSYPYPIQRADAARYFTLHRYGGLYADLDIEALSDPTQLISGGHDLVLFYDWMNAPKFRWDPLPWRGEDPGVGNALMASVPGHEFWEFLAERLVKSKLGSDVWVPWDLKNTKIERTFWSTGPWFISVSANEYMKQRPDANVGTIEPKYWNPFPVGCSNPGNCKQSECEDKALCKKRFPYAILFHHSVAQWDDRGVRNGTSVSKRGSRTNGRCHRDEWMRAFNAAMGWPEP